MRRLTSRMTFIYKRVLPTIYFGFLGMFICVAYFTSAEEGGQKIAFLVTAFFLAPLLAMAFFMYFFMKKFFWDLIDEVYDEGSILLFKSRGKEARVSLKDIKNVSYSVLMSPPRVTLSIRYRTVLGDELSFSPPASWIPFKKNKLIEELIDRIDQARG